MRRRTVLLVVVAMLGGTGPAGAARLGVYFDEQGSESKLEVGPGQPFQFYVSASEISGSVSGFECTVAVDPQITVTARQMPHPRAIDIGIGEDNWIVGLGEHVSVAGALPLVRYSAMLLAAAEGLSIRLEPANPASNGARGPQYLVDGEVLEFDQVSGASLNAAQESWGKLKDHYEDP